MKFTLTLETENITKEEIPGIIDHVKTAIKKGNTTNTEWANDKGYSFALTEEGDEGEPEYDWEQEMGYNSH